MKIKKNQSSTQQKKRKDKWYWA